MQIRRRLGFVAFAAWLAILVAVFAYAVRPDQNEGAKQNSPASRPRPSTVLREATPGSSVVGVDPNLAGPDTEADATDAEVLGTVQPFTGFSLFRPRSTAVTPLPFVLPEFLNSYLGPGFVYTGPVVTSPAPTTGGTAGPPPTRPPTPTTGPTTTTPPPTAPPVTEPPTTEPPTTEPPTTEPPTTEPPPPPDTVPPETTPDP